MPKKSIKIEIASRHYPISIDEAEEHILLKAVDDLKVKIKNLQQHYGVNREQDLLAMAALQLAMDVQKNNSSLSETTSEKKLTFIIDKLKSYLQEDVL